MEKLIKGKRDIPSSRNLDAEEKKLLSDGRKNRLPPLAPVRVLPKMGKVSIKEATAGSLG